jgi:hypothetical protein
MTARQKRGLLNFAFMLLSGLFSGLAGGWEVGLAVTFGLWAIGGWIELNGE